jgi:dihydroneopterin triphosphate diphosphatase
MPHASRLTTTFVDVSVLRRVAGRWEALVLRRAPGGRCPGAWETVHGRIEPGETPVQAALRELLEETGLTAERWYNLSRVESFYLHRTDEVALIPVFVAVVGEAAPIMLSVEHDRAEWMPPDRAASTFAWPRERRAIEDAMVLLASGDAGPLEDVLRIG